MCSTPHLHPHNPLFAPHPPAPPDDDNDLALAALVRRAYLPGVTADSVRAAAAAAPARFHVSACRGVWGTEELLELLIGEHLAGGGPDACPADF